MAILLVEEKVPFATALADRVDFMDSGKKAHSGTIDELQGEKKVFVRYLGVEV